MRAPADWLAAQVAERPDDFAPSEMAVALAWIASIQADARADLNQKIAELISQNARDHEASQKAYFEVDAAWHAKRKQLQAAERIVRIAADFCEQMRLQGYTKGLLPAEYDTLEDAVADWEKP